MVRSQSKCPMDPKSNTYFRVVSFNSFPPFLIYFPDRRGNRRCSPEIVFLNTKNKNSGQKQRSLLQILFDFEFLFSSFPRPLFRQDDLLDEEVYLEAVLVESVPGRRPDRHLLRVRVAGVARVGPVEVHHQGALLDLEKKDFFKEKRLFDVYGTFVGKKNWETCYYICPQ